MREWRKQLFQDILKGRKKEIYGLIKVIKNKSQMQRNGGKRDECKKLPY